MPRAISIDDVYIHISENEAGVAHEVANLIANVIQKKTNARISFATGHTMIPVYEELVKEIKYRELKCDQIALYHLDEYHPCSDRVGHSFVKYLHDRLVLPLFLSDGQCHFMNGEASDPELEAARYDSLLHDIDLSIVGIGPGGHIGFNESGASFESRTRLVNLGQETLTRDHLERQLETPTQAITQGIANVLEAERVVMVAFGQKKAELIRKTFRDQISENCPASALRGIPNKVKVFLDEEAASLL